MTSSDQHKPDKLSRWYQPRQRPSTVLYYSADYLAHPAGQAETQYSTVQYSTVQYSTVQYSTVQYSTVQYSTVQYSTGYLAHSAGQAETQGPSATAEVQHCHVPETHRRRG